MGFVNQSFMLAISILFMLLLLYTIQSMNFNELIIMIMLSCIFMSFNTINMYNFWTGFILFMTFVGGIMILFSFVSSNIESKMLKFPQLLISILILTLIMNFSNKEITFSNMEMILKINSFMPIFLFIMLNLNLFFISNSIKSQNKPFKKI